MVGIKRVMLFICCSVVLSTLMFSSTSATQVCGVQIEEPWFSVERPSGEHIFVLDNDGDLFLRGTSHSETDLEENIEAFQLGNMTFTNAVSLYGTIQQNASLDTSGSGKVIFKDKFKIPIAVASDDSLQVKGSAAYEGSQGKCMPDGSYCVGNELEQRDYSCSITGNLQGTCTMSVKGSENCLLRPTEETDSGQDYWNQGSVTDYTGCSDGSCDAETYTDYCVSETRLKEYEGQNTSYAEKTYDCAKENNRYCSDNAVYEREFSCDHGACSLSSDTQIKTCSAPATEHGSWSCEDSDTKVRTVTEYSSGCSNGGCTVSSSQSQEYQNCGSNEYCSSGSCKEFTYSWETSDWGSCSASPEWQTGSWGSCSASPEWQTGSWGSCSASCGYGSHSRRVWCSDDDGSKNRNVYCTDTSGSRNRDVYCTRDQDRKVVSDSKCEGGKPSRTTSCSESCSNWNRPSSSTNCYESCEGERPTITKSCYAGSCCVSNKGDRCIADRVCRTYRDCTTKRDYVWKSTCDRKKVWYTYRDCTTKRDYRWVRDCNRGHCTSKKVWYTYRDCTTKRDYRWVKDCTRYRDWYTYQDCQRKTKCTPQYGRVQCDGSCG